MTKAERLKAYEAERRRMYALDVTGAMMDERAKQIRNDPNYEPWSDKVVGCHSSSMSRIYEAYSEYKDSEW